MKPVRISINTLDEYGYNVFDTTPTSFLMTPSQDNHE